MTTLLLEEQDGSFSVTSLCEFSFDALSGNIYATMLGGDPMEVPENVLVSVQFLSLTFYFKCIDGKWIKQ